MTDQQTQRYRPLAVGEVTECGDQRWRWIDDRWVNETLRIGVVVGSTDRFRRPIPETNWRDPVDDAGYPYPPGTVVELDDKEPGECAYKVFFDNDWLYWFHDGGHCLKPVSDVSFVKALKHRVIDYRPDLLAQETSADETQTNLSRTGETQEPTTPASLASRILDIVSFQYEDDPVTRMGHDTLMKGCDEEATELVERWQSAELTRLRAEVERYAIENERLRFKLRKAEMVEGDYATLCILTDERDEARNEVERLNAEFAKHNPSEIKAIDLTETTVFVGAAWGVKTGEIQ